MRTALVVCAVLLLCSPVLRGQILTAVAHDFVWGDEPLTRIPTSEPSEGIDVR